MRKIVTIPYVSIELEGFLTMPAPEVDFSRDVWCVLGLPFDNVGLQEAAARIRQAVRSGGRIFLSTPNVNWVVACRSDADYRDSVIHSDLSLADGMPLIWVARLLGVPLPGRVAGSDLMLELQRDPATNPMSVFFFGGGIGVADEACKQVNKTPSGLKAVGGYFPGFGSVEAMSQQEVIDTINSRNPDFLLLAIGAKKAQAWIESNRSRLNARVIGHLGAVVNFLGGSVKRAPEWMRLSGMEWIWRILQEPALWRRYFFDGLAFGWLLLSRVIPYAILRRFESARTGGESPARCEITELPDQVIIRAFGRCTHDRRDSIRPIFAAVAAMQRPCSMDLSGVERIDGAFIGLVFLLRKSLAGSELRVINAGNRVARCFYWNCADYLLEKH